MNEKTRNLINTVLVGVLLFGLTVCCLLKPDTSVSVNERRKLKTMPELSVETVFNRKGGSSFMDEFEVYAKDQFPLRELFRKVNAVSGRYLLGRTEINGLYTADGHIAKLEDGIHEKDLNWSLGRMQNIIDTYAQDRPVYLAVIPDKNCLLAPLHGYPYADAEAIARFMEDGLGDRVQRIDLISAMHPDDFYLTDTHWRQEEITDLAELILSSMHRPCDRSYETQELITDFKGVYHGQAALPFPSETLRYLCWEGMEEMQVNCYDSSQPVPMEMYDLKKAEDMDPYEVFLSGSKALITIENPEIGDGELVLFRDSFGSSMAPLLTAGYHKITLVDIRYISPAMLSKFIDFENADILFMYSTAVLNNSIGQFLK